MLNEANTQRVFINSALVVSMLCLAVPSAMALDGPRADRAARDTESSSGRDAGSQVRQATSNISFIAFDGATNPAFISEPAVSTDLSLATRPRTVGGNPTPTPVPRVPPAVSTAPMTSGEKFKLFAQKSFWSPGAFALSVVSGVYGEWTDNKNNHHHANPGDFAADSMTRAARSFTFRANANFFEKFMFASLFRQDPRYHRSEKKGAGAKIAYAVSRLFVTQGDRNGKDQFNVSFLAGGLAASGMANLWERDERRDLHHFATRFGVHLGLTALTNILREFIGGQ